MPEEVDLLIIGAGWHGLAMAKTYKEATASGGSTSILLMDEAETIGGTWASERLYPGLKTNNIVGTYEFSDFPLVPGRYGLKEGQHIPGEVVHRYLADAATEFGLDGLIRFRTRVDTATLLDDDDGTWLIDYHVLPSSGHGSDRVTGAERRGTLTARKLVIATGLTSEPSMPEFPGRETFKGNLFHAKQFKHRARHALDGANEVVVVGGNKSAWDVSYHAAAGSGARVHMVMKPSGGGPCWVWRPLRLGSLVRTSISRLSSTRFFTWFDPSPFGSTWGRVRGFLHRTRAGRAIASLFWAGLDRCAAAASGYDDPQLAMLRPWASTFWVGDSLGIHNYGAGWWGLVRSGKIVVHHAEVVSLDGTRVHLSGGQVVEADTVVSCTGWKCVPAIDFKPEGVAASLGLPRAVTTSFQEGREGRQEAELIGNVREKIMRDCPTLRSRPVRRMPETSANLERFSTSAPRDKDGNSLAAAPPTTPYRLYRFLVPPGGRTLEMRNLAFIGMLRSTQAVIVAQAQALWATAFLLDKLALPGHNSDPDPGLEPDARSRGRSTIRYETYLHTEYERARRPRQTGGSGDQFPDLLFDSIPYVDLLLQDLGLPPQRKKNLWGDVFEPHFPRDYRGLVAEWLDRDAQGFLNRGT